MPTATWWPFCLGLSMLQIYDFNWGVYVGGLGQDCNIYIANALEILEPYKKPTIWLKGKMRFYVWRFISRAYSRDH